MSDQVIIALLGVIPSIVAAAAAIYSVRVSMGNRSVINQVKSQTDGLMQSFGASEKAKGVEAGHAAGVAAGVTAGAKEQRDSQK
jgi:hypothetical protein